MNILLTGCAGFIGSHLSEKLLLEGHNVTGIDCFTDYYSPEIKKKNISNILNNKNFDFKNTDLSNTDLRSMISDKDVIIHVAAQPGVRASWGENFKIYVKNNIEITQKLLEACLNSNIKKFIFTSSSSVYGDCKETPIKETSPTLPISPYGVTKLAAENLCYLYGKNYNLPFIILRYFTVYGPRQRPDMGINKFVAKISSYEEIELFGFGKLKRDFTYISDVVEATIISMNSKFIGEIFNIGGGTQISVLELINLLEKELGKKANVKLVEKQKGEMEETLADITKAKNLLGWYPRHGIEEGVKKYIEWYKSEMYGKT